MVCMLMTLRWLSKSMDSISYSLYFKNLIGISDDGSCILYDCWKVNFNPSQTDFIALSLFPKIVEV